MTMTFDELEDFFVHWYGAPASAFRLAEENVEKLVNLTLRQFYARFGVLAESKSAFRHPKSRYGPLSAQDHFYPVAEITNESGCDVFLIENQGCFEAAAGVGPTTMITGDVGAERYGNFEETGIPLAETLVACALLETVSSVQDRDRLTTVADIERYRAIALCERHLAIRTVYPEPFHFWISPDLVAFSFDQTPGMFARLEQWKQTPPLFQDREYEGGGGSTSGPSNPTAEQIAEREWSLAAARSDKLS